MNYETSLSAETDEARLSGDLPPDGESGLSRRKLLMMGALALIVLLIVAALIHGSRNDTATEDAAANLPVVSVIVPGTTTVASTIDATGTLAARRSGPTRPVRKGE